MVMVSRALLGGCCRPLLLLLLLMVSVLAVRAGQEEQKQDSLLACPELDMQTGLDLEQMSGTWYVVEEVPHQTSGRSRQLSAARGQLECAVLHLGLTDGQMVVRWEQQPPYQALDYVFAVNSTLPGLWSASSSPWSWPPGTPAEQIQVMKAVGDHAALTFCQPGAGGLVFTAVLGRHNQLTAAQLRGINGLLQRRGLAVQDARTMDESLCYKHRSWTQGTASAASKRTRHVFAVLIIALGAASVIRYTQTYI